MSSKDLTEALHKLTMEAQGQPSAIPAMKARGAAPAVTASALLGGSGSGGIASPLKETAYTNRTFHSTVNITSSDGIFTLVIKPVKKVFFKDALNADVEMEYKSP